MSRTTGFPRFFTRDKQLRNQGAYQFYAIIKALLQVALYFIFILFLFALGMYLLAANFDLDGHPIGSLNTMEAVLEFFSERVGAGFAQALFPAPAFDESGVKVEQVGLEEFFGSLAMVYFLFMLAVWVFLVFYSVFARVAGGILSKVMSLAVIDLDASVNRFKDGALVLAGISYGLHLIGGDFQVFVPGLSLAFIFSAVFFFLLMFQFYLSAETYKSFTYLFAMNSVLVLSFLAFVFLMNIRSEAFFGMMLDWLLLLLGRFEVVWGLPESLAFILSNEQLSVLAADYSLWVFHGIGAIGIILMALIQVIQMALHRLRNAKRKDAVMYVLVFLLFDVAAFIALYAWGLLNHAVWVFVLNGGIAILLQKPVFRNRDLAGFRFTTLALLSLNYTLGMVLPHILAGLGFVSSVTLLSQAMTVLVAQGIAVMSERRGAMAQGA